MNLLIYQATQLLKITHIIGLLICQIQQLPRINQSIFSIFKPYLYKFQELFLFTIRLVYNERIISLNQLYLLMTQRLQKYKIERILRTTKEIQDQRRKFSADYKRRDKYVRQKEKKNSSVIGHFFEKEELSHRRQKSNGYFDSVTRQDKQYKEFSQKCLNMLSKKKIAVTEQGSGRQNYGSILEEIKKVLRESDKKERENKEKDNKPMPIEQFQNLHRKIHQNNSVQARKQLFRLNRSNDLSKFQRNDWPKAGKYESCSKQTQNPFFQTQAIICNSVILNDPSTLKRSFYIDSGVSKGAHYSFNAQNYTSYLGKRVVNISKPLNQKIMSFQIEGENDGLYMRRLRNFMNFIFKVNFSNNIYIPLDLAKLQDISTIQKRKVYVGKGNNCLLVKSILKRRFWWQITTNIEQQSINFYWSQSKLDKVHDKQKIIKNKVDYKIVNPPAKKLKQSGQIDTSNRKILSQQKSNLVEKYILNESLIVPFQDSYESDIMSNHIPKNNSIGSKKNLFKSLYSYFKDIKNENPFNYIPKTYHLRSNQDEMYAEFVKQNQNQPQKVWIVKPGQNTNRGNGIKLASFKSIHELLNKNKHSNGQQFTYIVQSYINKPFLYNNRKFDIRHYMLLTSVNGIMKAYWYKEGYIRTSCQVFTLDNLNNPYIHLTNDAIQRNSQDYQKYQPANKLSYTQFQRYLDSTYPSKNYNFERDVLSKMKELATHIVKANYLILDNKRHKNNFQIFGLDFMIDREFKTYLIEVNYNPCLEVNCPILERIIPPMIQNSFRVGLDPIFPPPSHYPVSKRFYLSDHYLKNLKYQLIFDQDSLKQPILNRYSFDDEKQEEEQYQDQGQQIKEVCSVLE